MAEMDRNLYNATDREGRPLPPNAIRIMGFLWTFVVTEDATRYRKEQENRRAPRVQRSAAKLAEELNGLEVETISKLLKKLSEAGYVVPVGGRTNVWALLDQRHRDERLRALDASLVAVKKKNRGDLANPCGDQVANLCGTSANPCGRSRKSMQQIPHGFADDPLRVPIGSQLGPESGSHARALDSSSPPDFFSIAFEILSASPTPEGAAPIPPNRWGARCLITLLEAGESAEDICQVLAAAPAIIAAGLQSVDWYGPEMFVAGVWSHWRRALAKLRARQRLPAEPPPLAPAVTQPRESDLVASLMRELEAPRTANSFELEHMDRLPAHRRAMLESPAAALAAARRACEAAMSEGRTVRLDELELAIASVTPREAGHKRPSLAELEAAEEAELVERSEACRRRAAQAAAIDEVIRRDPQVAIAQLRQLLARGSLSDEEARLVERRLAELVTQRARAPA